METLETIEEELGASIKRDCESKGISMRNYDPKAKTYTPWYKLPIKVEFGRMHPRSYGKFNIWKRKIKIDPSQDNPAATLYHETLHADVAPFTTGLKLAAVGTIFYAAYETLSPELRNATQTLSPMIKSWLGLGAVLAVRHGEEYLIRLREKAVFGRNKENGK